MGVEGGRKALFHLLISFISLLFKCCGAGGGGGGGEGEYFSTC